MFRKPSDGEWGLSDENSINGVSAVHNGSPIVHISFNHQGHELAIFDSLGKISIFTIMFTVNDIAAPRKCVIDTEDQVNEVVGLLWLNTDKPVLLVQRESALQESAHFYSNRFILQLTEEEGNGTSRRNSTRH